MSIIDFIKHIFKTDSGQQNEKKFKPDPNAYFFHEDFYRQIEYLPKENFISASQVAAEIIEHSEKTFDGFGWTGCYVRNEASIPIRSKKIRVTDLIELLLQEEFSEYPSVTTGYSSSVFPCDNTRAFRKKSIVLCVEFKGDILENIWHNDSPLLEDNATYKAFLLTMADKYNLLLADWWKSIVVDISNPEEIDKYFLYDD
jgi:hypothetical protein